MLAVFPSDPRTKDVLYWKLMTCFRFKLGISLIYIPSQILWQRFKTPGNCTKLILKVNTIDICWAWYINHSSLRTKDEKFNTFMNGEILQYFICLSKCLSNHGIEGCSTIWQLLGFSPYKNKWWHKCQQLNLPKAGCKAKKPDLDSMFK